MIDIERSIEVLAHIELAERDQHAGMRWDQGSWGIIQATDPASALDRNDDVIVDPITGLPVGTGSCGTAFCFAGWALTLAHIPLKWEWEGEDAFVCNSTATGRLVSSEAADLLGLRGEQTALFSATNDLDDLYRLISDYGDLDEEDLRRQVQDRMVAIVNKTPAGEGVKA